MRKLCFLMLICLSFCTEVLGERSFTSVEDYSHWMTYYYKNPNPREITSGMLFYPTSELYNRRSSIVPSSHFYAAILRGTPLLLPEVYDLGKTQPSMNLKYFVLNTLWLVNSKEAKQLIDRAKTEWNLPTDIRQNVQTFSTRTPTWALDAPVNSPLSLDILWAIYSATGDKAPVQKIISVVHWAKNGSGEQLRTGGAAQWSLTSQALNNPDIQQIVRECATSSTGVTKEILDGILVKAKTNEK